MDFLASRSPIRKKILLLRREAGFRNPILLLSCHSYHVTLLDFLWSLASLLAILSTVGTVIVIVIGGLKSRGLTKTLI
jgi:hypothetical protein